MAVSGARTALMSGGTGTVVQGTALSVALVLGDARRHGEPAAWFQTDQGQVEVATDVDWELEELEAA